MKDNDDGGDSKPPLDAEEGVARRRDAALKRMLETPPRQHQEDVGKNPKPGKAKDDRKRSRPKPSGPS